MNEKLDNLGEESFILNLTKDKDVIRRESERMARIVANARNKPKKGEEWVCEGWEGGL